MMIQTTSELYFKSSELAWQICVRQRVLKIYIQTSKSELINIEGLDWNNWLLQNVFLIHMHNKSIGI